MNEHLNGNSKGMEAGSSLRSFYSNSTHSESCSCSWCCVSNKDNFQRRYESNKVNGIRENCHSSTAEVTTNSKFTHPIIIDGGQRANNLESMYHLPVHYRVKDKKQRHIYHTITISNNDFKPLLQKESRLNDQVKVPPLIPFKPHYLRAEYANASLPLIPPRVKNREAVIKRKLLTEEYFENICRSVDFADNESVSNDADLTASRSNICESSVFENVEHSSSSLASSPGPSVVQSTSESVTAIPSTCTTNHGLNISNDLTYSLKSLKLCGWYWGNMTWKEAEMMLKQKEGEIGLFLLRDSQDPLHILTVTVRTDTETIRHIRVEYTDGKFQLYDPNRSTSRGAANCVRHSNIITFIKLAMKHSRNGNFLYFVRPRSMGEAPIQIQLLSPISRFSCVKSLKYYSRFVIRNAVPLEDVSNLPIPPELQRYVHQCHYFDPTEDLQCSLRA